MLRTIAITAIMFISLALFAESVYSDSSAQSQQPIVVVAAPQAKPSQDPLLNATVRIVMQFEQNGVTYGDPALGTVVNRDGQLAIMTHNHWSSLRNGTATKAEIFTMDGRLAAQLPAHILQAMTIHQDAGTLLFWAPLELTDPALGLTPAQLGDPASLQPGTTLQIVYGHATVTGGTFTIATVTVDALTSRDGLAAFTMRSTAGEEVERGNSGGAIYLNGKLVGNMWKTFTLVDGTPTSSSLAATLPATNTTVSAAPADTPSPVAADADAMAD